ncbi:unnamed protein product [Urochloa humidicola]
MLFHVKLITCQDSHKILSYLTCSNGDGHCNWRTQIRSRTGNVVFLTCWCYIYVLAGSIIHIYLSIAMIQE